LAICIFNGIYFYTSRYSEFKMRLSTSLAALLLAGPLVIRSAPEDAIRGFDPAAQAQEVQWERQARAIPDAAHISDFIRKYSSQPHLAGTPQSKQTAEGILAQLKSYGLDAHIETFEALLPTPKTRFIEMTAPAKLKLKLEEPPVPEDPNSKDPGMVPPYLAYSADGDVTAPLVYVNYGLPEDYQLLHDRGIDVKGKIVITRYGNAFRGVKPKLAWEHGAIGCIIYSDPRDDGFFEGDVYPKGPFRPSMGVQRGSALDLPIYPGDPLSPGWASEPGSKRLPISEAETMQKIPVLPISYGEAQPLLQNMTGPVAPESWRGALPITYHLGPGNTIVHMNVVMDNSTHPLYDVIARIPGSQFPDEWVLDGNHHDAWVHGASDPLSGAAPLMETARTLAEMTKNGWKPKRTVLLAFWDGEEFGLAGSTEWMEKHAEELDRSLAVYINSDSSGKGRFNAGGSHTLEEFVQQLERDVNDPVSGKPLLNPQQRDFRIGALGSGSDYTPFLQHLGVASLDLRFGSEDGGVYHSDYDDYYWYSHFSDTTFVHGRALAQVLSTALMRLADSELLPFEFGRFTTTVRRYADELNSMTMPSQKIDLTPIRNELSTLQQNAGDLNASYARALSNHSSLAKAADINRILYRTERAMIVDPGLPGRAWYRHRIYAPGRYTGYAVKTLPGVREAIEAGKPDEAREQITQLLHVLQALNEEVAQAASLLGQI
jgi:N-acetylated-alpha-linked acidic dipeptidase